MSFSPNEVKSAGILIDSIKMPPLFRHRTPATLAKLLLGAALVFPTGAAADTERIAFPNDPSVLDAKRNFGAVGDGVADDTTALQRGLAASWGSGGSTKILFIPNGTYRVTSNLVVTAGVGPWVYGESRDGVTIRLADGVSTNITSVLRCHPSDRQSTSADFFMRNFRNLTFDVGNNPGVDGVRWYGNNSSILKNVRVIGTGRIGINSGFLDQNGPNLIQDALVEGSFETGVNCAWSWGQTLSRITVRNARKVGVYVNATAVGIEDLVVENTPIALHNEYPNDWTWWGGVIALVGGRFTGNNPNQPAITNSSVLYARNVTATGFKQVLRSTTSGGSVTGTNLIEYSSDAAVKLFPDSPNASFKLPILPEPDVPWETNLTNWVCANTYGATYGDGTDDTAAIQAAIDAAAAAGKTVVYLRGIGGGDPNWYNVNGEVRVRGSVRHIIGLGFGRILGGANGKFVVDDASAPFVKFQHFQAFGGTSCTVENRSTNRTLIVESCDFKILGTGLGDIFVTDCPSSVQLRSPGQRLWARQLNPEGTSDTGLVQNHGGRLWALGVKHEGAGVRWLTDNGGQTEILGLFNYAPDIAASDLRPEFDIDNSPFCAMGVREISFGNTYPVKAREIRLGDIRTQNGGGWIGWSLYSGWSPAQTNGAVAVAWPRLAPAGGSFANSLSVTAQTTTAAAELRCTTDGSEPTTSSPLCPLPLVLTNSTNLKVKGFKAGLAPSATASAIFLRQEFFPLLSITNIWRYDQTDDLTSVTNWFASAYSDAAWPTGRALLCVETAVLPAPKNTLLTLGRITYYFRSTFVVPTNLVPLTLTASNLIDDGAVFYLNGAELKRIRMNSGTVAYTNLANGSPGSGDATVWDVFTIPTNSLVPGTNLLAVEVHQSAMSSLDIVFGCALSLGAQRRVTITNQPPSRAVPAGTNVSLSVGVDGSGPLSFQWRHNGADIPGATNASLDLPAITVNDLGAYSVRVSNFISSAVSSNATLTLDPLGPPALLTANFNSNYTQVTLTFHKPITPASATNLANYALTGPGGSIALLNATLVNGTNVVLTVAPQAPGDFTVAVALLLDASGQAILRGSRMTVGQRVVLVPIAATWKYDQRGVDLGTGWRNTTYHDTTWPSGPALLAYETSGPLPETIRTPLTTNVNKITFYFRTRFNLPISATNISLSLRQIIDDGVVIYLNGTELSRTRLNANPVTYATLADTQPVDPAPHEGPFTLPAVSLLPGTNVLAAEVHQSSATSSDIVFGAELVAVIASEALPPLDPRVKVELLDASHARLFWTGDPASLEQALQVTGPWSLAPSQSNPQTNTTATNTFFRLR